jgi:hypothetical protein
MRAVWICCNAMSSPSAENCTRNSDDAADPKSERTALYPNRIDVRRSIDIVCIVPLYVYAVGNHLESNVCQAEPIAYVNANALIGWQIMYDCGNYAVRWGMCGCTRLREKFRVTKGDYN